MAALAGFVLVVALLLLADRTAGGPYAIVVALLVCALAVAVSYFDPHRR